MSLPVVIVTKLERPAGVSVRDHREWAKEAHRVEGQYWQHEVLPPRFTPASPHYPHRPRSAGYLRQKARAAMRGIAIFGGQVLNVYTGKMASLLMQPGTVRAFPTRVSIRKFGPRYITMRPYKSDQPDKWAELAYVKRSEANHMARLLMETYDRLRRESSRTEVHSTN